MQGEPSRAHEPYPGSMQSWISATHECFCRESMVSRMYSAPFSTWRRVRTRSDHVWALHLPPGNATPECSGTAATPHLPATVNNSLVGEH